MVTVRTAKSKGNQFEMDCEASLQQVYKDAYRTHERGYIMGYDIKTDIGRAAFECKRLKGISWNQLVKFWEKLNTVKPMGYRGYILFKSNNQPCLVFNGQEIHTFEFMFQKGYVENTSTRFERVKFLKHLSTKSNLR